MTDDKPSGTKWTKLIKQLKEEDDEEGDGDEKEEHENELQSQTIISKSDGMSGIIFSCLYDEIAILYSKR